MYIIGADGCHHAPAITAVMRILHVVPTYIPAWRYGGPIQSVHGLCKALAAAGHQVEVLTTSVNGPVDSEVAIGVPVDVEGVPVRYFRCPAMRRLYWAPAMRRHLESTASSWEVIHTHSVFLWPTAAAAAVARRRTIPYVVSPRGMLVADLIAKRSTIAKRAWIAMVERRNIDRADSVHVTSRIEAEDLLKLGFHPRRMVEIPNGFDLAPDAVASNFCARNHLPRQFALFLGRISWKKGIDRLIRALSLVPDLELVVAGNDDEGHWPAMAALAAKEGLTHRIRYVGFVEGNDKAALLAAATMLVLPSYSENFGNVVLEAMALGTPVVVTPEVGASTLVSQAGSGVVVEGDPSRLAGAMSRLLSSAELRENLGKRGRASARNLGWDAIARQFEAHYEDVLTARK